MFSNAIPLINFLVFQLGWIIIVSYHHGVAGLIGLVLSFVNYFMMKNAFKELLLGFLIAFLGLLNDIIMVKIGFLHFSNATICPVPLWLASLWLLFASTFSSSLAWLRGAKVFFLAFLGSLGGALSYSAAEKLSALSYHSHLFPQFLFYGLNWFVLFPVLFILHHRIRNKIYRTNITLSCIDECKQQERKSRDNGCTD